MREKLKDKQMRTNPDKDFIAYFDQATEKNKGYI